jgi:hypothetical protein
MTTFIFTGDMLVMLFMIGVVVWMSFIETDERIDFTSRIPLDDEPEERHNDG